MAYSPEQIRNFQIALNMTKGDPAKVRRALIEAMLVESGGRQLDYGDRDSEGVLQQRPSQGWGSFIPGAAGVRQDVRDFLVRARGSANAYGTAGQLAQGVQRSAFPDRYDQRRSQADALIARLGGGKGAPMPQARSTGTPAARANVAGGLDAGQRYVLSLAGLGDITPFIPQAGAGGEGATGHRRGAGMPFPVRPQGGQPPARGKLSLTELFYDPLGAYKLGNPISPIGGHSDHVHYAGQSAQEVVRAIAIAKNLGLSVRENPFVDPVDPVHTKNSYHYRTFPGMTQGKKVGKAIDVSGSPQGMSAYYKRLVALCGRR